MTVTNCDDCLLLELMKSHNDEKYLRAFGKRLAELRRSGGYTQESLAEKIGVTAHSLALIEQGQRWPRLATIHKIAKAIDVPTDELFKGLKQ